MEFNILKEPWIPAIFLSGERRELGLLDTLNQAPNIRGLDLANPMEEYGIYRLLILFLMAMYQPKNAFAVVNILQKKKVDEEKLNEYLECCKKEGVSFDIFDEERPFLQSPYDPRWDSDKSLKSVAELDYTHASGNNAVHFDHTFEEDACMTPAEAARALPAVQIFCTAGLQGPSNVYGAPPLFFLVQGKNLFETLIFSMVPLTKGKETPPEIWRCTDIVEPGKKVAETSLLYGMLFPSRRVRLVEKNGKVNRAYFQAGLNYVGYEGWRDPHAAYFNSSKGVRSTLKLLLNRELWRNIGTLAENFAQYAPTIIYQFQNLFSDESNSNMMHVMLFGAVTHQASYLDIQRGEVDLDIRITESPEKCSSVSQAVRRAEFAADCLNKALHQFCADQLIIKKMGQINFFNVNEVNTARKQFWKIYKDFDENKIQTAVHEFYAECGQAFLGEFCPTLAEAKSEEEKEQVETGWEKTVCQKVWTAYSNFNKHVGTSANWLMAGELARKTLYRFLSPFKKQKVKGEKKNG